MNGPALEPSPDILPRTPAPNAGVRRLNRVPLLMVLMLGAMVIGTIGYTYYSRVQNQRHEDAEAEAVIPQGANANVMFKDAPNAGLIAPDMPPTVPMQPVPIPAPAEKAQAPAAVQSEYSQAWQAYRQQQLQIAQAREQAALSALTAGPEVGGKGGSSPAVPMTASLAVPRVQSAIPPEIRGVSGDLNQQAGKRGFFEHHSPSGQR